MARSPTHRGPGRIYPTSRNFMAERPGRRESWSCLPTRFYPRLSPWRVVLVAREDSLYFPSLKLFPSTLLDRTSEPRRSYPFTMLRSQSSPLLLTPSRHSHDPPLPSTYSASISIANPPFLHPISSIPPHHPPTPAKRQSSACRRLALALVITFFLLRLCPASPLRVR